MATLTNEHIMAMARHETAVRNAFAACKRAFTMVQNVRTADLLPHLGRLVNILPDGHGTYSCDKNACPMCRATAAIKAARTMMAQAQEKAE